MTEKPAKPFRQGMTLQPGERAYIDIPISFKGKGGFTIKIDGGNLNVEDISAQTYGKYQYCTKARDGMWYADSDFTLGSGCGKPKRGALPCPEQDTPELTKRARKMHEESARKLTESIMPTRKPWWRFW